ncbi:hypothetical protein D3C72_1900880 [compost metagenome]
MPAVTLPSFLKAGFSLARDSAVVPARGPSSVSKATGSPLRCGIRIGVISSLKRPASMAAAAFCWEAAAKASCCSRVRPYFATRFSAVTPMW